MQESYWPIYTKKYLKSQYAFPNLPPEMHYPNPYSCMFLNPQIPAAICIEDLDSINIPTHPNLLR